MAGFFDLKSKQAGLPPGSLVYHGDRPTDGVRIELIDYDGRELREREVDDLDELRALPESPTISWVNIDGLHDTGIVGRLGEIFGLHSLVLEDILNTHQRAKLDIYDEYLFLVARMIRYDADEVVIFSEQISFIIGPTFVLSFQEKSGDVFEPVRERLRQARGRIRGSGPDYLGYALLDAMVDQYFIVLEQIGEYIQQLETQLLEDPGKETLQDIYGLKRELLHLRRSIWPLREVVSQLHRDPPPLIRAETKLFLRDVYDHCIHVIDVLESLRETVSGMVDLYLSSLSQRTNAVMQVLTVVASIFIPLTFIAGVYGMNFAHMPELSWRWGYPGALGLMGILGAGMLLLFRRKGWI